MDNDHTVNSYSKLAVGLREYLCNVIMLCVAEGVASPWVLFP